MKLKKYFIISLIVHLIILIFGWYYSMELASGWDGLIVLFYMLFSVPIMIIDIIGLIVVHIKKKKQAAIDQEKKEFEQFCIERTGSAEILDQFDQAESATSKENEKKSKTKKVFTIILLIIMTIPTIFEIGSLISVYCESIFAVDSFEYPTSIEDVDFKTEEEIIKYAKERHGRHISLSYVKSFDAPIELDEEIIEYQGTEYVFKDNICDISFSIKQSIDYSIIDADYENDTYEYGYYELIESDYHEKHEYYVESCVIKELGKEYNTETMEIDSMYLSGWDSTLHVIVDIYADQKDIEYAEGKLGEISKDAMVLLRKYDKHGLFGRVKFLNQKEYIVDVELDRSWLLYDDFRQYDVIGKYYQEDDKYVRAKGDLDGLTLPEYVWEDEEYADEMYDNW